MVSLSLFSSRRSASKQRPANAEHVPDKPCPRLDFWISGARDDLIDRILPHMTRAYRENQSFTTLREEKAWVVELVQSESGEDDEEDEDDDEDGDPEPQSLARCKAAFENSPQTMVDDLVLVSRSWFRFLLRHTFRARYSKATDRDSARLALEDLGGDFDSRIDEKSLLKRPTLYKDYKDIYKETKSRSGWTKHCDRVKSLCLMIGLQTSSTKLEAIFEDLQRNLPQILHDRMAEMQRMATSLQDELEVHRLDESLKACRELMEKLLPDDAKGKGAYRPRGQEYGRRWRELYAKEWQRCKRERPRGHPLLKLVNDDTCFPVGQNLYGTLSERIHNHQQHRDQELDGTVLRVVFSILPPDWEETRRWDLSTEKGRWGLA
ncbi:unnamed protein product [Periconia digitata]|uniref:Uncharacterized protein n=1 Tax=Periconia digitata TaxID=1303443 RepID=A0A9W4UBD8_9PLEO|nr:unnamed protein product [Periconia digitata]